MSIETEFESTITNVQNAYQGLDNLGATIPQNKTIENIKSCLDEIYNNLPKTSYAEGSNITLSNTLKGKLDFENGVVGIGQSSQDSTKGDNFANLNGMNTTTNNGVTFTINKENGLTKSVKINGTSVNYDSYCIGTAYLLPAGTYVVYGNGVTNNIITQIVNDTQTAQLGYSGKDDNTMTLEQDTNIIVRLRVTVGSTINNVEVKPMIATTSGKDFEQYTGGQASPNPSYPQEIKYVRGKNLWGGFSPFTKTQGGLTFTTNTDGSIDISGTATEICTSSTVAEAIANNLFIKLEKGIYSVSGGGSNYVIQIYDKNANIIANTQLGTTSVTFTLTQTTEIMCRVFIDSGGAIFNTKAKVQLEERKCSYSIPTI